MTTDGARRDKAAIIELADVDPRWAWVDPVLGVVNRLVLLLLAFATFSFIVLAISTSAMANVLTPHAGPVVIEQRASFILAACITGVACGLLSRRLNNTWAWAQLPTKGSIRVSRRGIQVRHAGVLDGEVRIEWSNIKAIALDSGANHDDGLAWRRFPLPSPHYDREYLFDTNGELREQFALIAGRPTAPNVAIILNEPVALRNPNSSLTEVSFPNRAKNGVPAQPPAGHTAATGLFLRTRNLKRTRNMLLPSGKLRALRRDDLN